MALSKKIFRRVWGVILLTPMTLLAAYIGWKIATVSTPLCSDTITKRCIKVDRLLLFHLYDHLWTLILVYVGLITMYVRAICLRMRTQEEATHHDTRTH